MSQHVFRSLLDKLNSTSTDIRASVIMTKDGVALVSAPPTDHPNLGNSVEDRISALSASIIHLGHKFMDDFTGGGLDRVLIKGKGGYMLAVHGQELVLAVLAKPDAQADTIFSQMEQVVNSLQHYTSEPTKKFEPSSNYSLQHSV